MGRIVIREKLKRFLDGSVAGGSLWWVGDGLVVAGGSLTAVLRGATAEARRPDLAQPWSVVTGSSAEASGAAVCLILSITHRLAATRPPTASGRPILVRARRASPSKRLRCRGAHGRGVNLWLGGLITAGAALVAVVVVTLVRRRAPDGGYFTDSDRAAGVFGVLGTAFAVVLAFVIFLAFESYGTAKKEAGREAVAVQELYNTAPSFEPAARDELRGQLVCYARSVVRDEWRTMKREQQSDVTQGWVDAMAANVDQLEITGEKQSVAYEHWFVTNAARAEARRGRLSEATPVVPAPLWFFLVFGGLLAVGYVVFWSDSGERFVVQAMMIGSLTAMVTASLLVVHFLDNPYENKSGSVEPVEMTRTLDLIEQKQEAAGLAAEPCDDAARPRERGVVVGRLP
ncbi:MAG: hypothetical protein ACR2HV_03410 [Acidimicrobiales bacterium]